MIIQFIIVCIKQVDNVIRKYLPIRKDNNEGSSKLDMVSKDKMSFVYNVILPHVQNVLLKQHITCNESQ